MWLLSERNRYATSSQSKRMANHQNEKIATNCPKISRKPPTRSTAPAKACIKTLQERALCNQKITHMHSQRKRHRCQWREEAAVSSTSHRRSPETKTCLPSKNSKIDSSWTMIAVIPSCWEVAPMPSKSLTIARWTLGSGHFESSSNLKARSLTL